MDADIESAGALATATRAAAALEGEAGKSSPAAPEAHAHSKCANCGAALVGDYCHACGQVGHVHRSLLHIGEELLHGILHFDTRSWRTLPLLVARPGLLTRRYIDGQRSRYVSPLPLFLFSIFLMFFTFSFVGGGSDEINLADPKSTEEARKQLTKAIENNQKIITERTTELAAATTPEAKAAAAEGLRDVQSELKTTEVALSALNGVTTAAGADAGASSIVASNVVAAIDSSRFGKKHSTLARILKHAVANPELTLYKLKNSAYKFAFMLVPISLPFLWLLFFWRRDITLYDHAIFALYSLSFMSLWFAFIALVSMSSFTSWLGFFAVLFIPAHMFLHVKETYGLGWFGATWRTIALLGVGMTVFFLFMAMVLAISLH